MNWKDIQNIIRKELKEAKRPDYPDVDGDGDRKEPMAKAFKDKKLKLGVKYKLPNGDTGYIMTGGSDDEKDWKFSGNKKPYVSYLSVKDKLKPLSTQPGKYDGAFDLGLGKGHHIDEVKKDCCMDSNGNVTHKSDWPGNACPKSHTRVPCEGPRPPKTNKNTTTNAIQEAEVTAGDSKFNLRTGVNKNPTKLGVKIQFEPKGGMLALDIKAKLEVALQEKLNTALAEYDIQVSKDTDVPRAEVIGFFIPLSQLKNLIVKALTGKKVEAPKVPAPAPNTPATPITPPSKQPAPPKPVLPVKDDVEEIHEQLIREALKIKELNEMSKTIIKEDFYGFINAGQNILRTLDEKGINNGKKYLEYLVKHNII
jgi:hypothetical protein